MIQKTSDEVKIYVHMTWDSGIRLYLDPKLRDNIYAGKGSIFISIFNFLIFFENIRVGSQKSDFQEMEIKLVRRTFPGVCRSEICLVWSIHLPESILQERNEYSFNSLYKILKVIKIASERVEQ